ncbi:MAG: hypothetical protein R8L53_00335 [Mariprofundales bacterium]
MVLKTTPLSLIIASLFIILLTLLTSCKMVDVPIPAAYPLYQESAVLIEPITGSYGNSISHQVMSKIKPHLPNTKLYTSMPNYLVGGSTIKKLVVLRGNVDVLEISSGKYDWGSFDEARKKQNGTATRNGNIQVSVSLARYNSGEILWAESFNETYEVRDDFSLHSDASIHESDSLQDAIEGKFKDAFEDVMRENRLENEAEKHIPDIGQVRNKLLNNISIEISQSFYNRIQKRLEFR